MDVEPYLPWRIGSVERRLGQEVVFEVFDRRGVPVAIFFDLHVTEAVLELLNGFAELSTRLR